MVVDRKYCKSDNIFYSEKRMLPHFGRVLYLLPMGIILVAHVVHEHNSWFGTAPFWQFSFGIFTIFVMRRLSI
jgi:hypothetical protein